MLKALFRKQFSEFFSMFLKDRRTGKARSKGGAILFIAIIVASAAGIGATFYSVAKSIIEPTSNTMPFLYYFVMGLIAVAIGLLGSIFNAYSTIYNAKDNELLLSMPIPPRHIVFVRVATLVALTMLYESVVLIPTFIARVVNRQVTLFVVINHLLLYFFVTLFVVALTLLLAFVVAAVARKVKRKSLVTVVISLIFVVVYYYLYFKAQNVLTELVKMTEVPSAIKKGLFLFYYMGLAAEGDAVGMLIVASISVAAFALSYAVITLLFRRFAVARSSATVRGKVGDLRRAKPSVALFKREWKRFISLPIYILNCSLGTLIMLGVGLVVYIKANAISQALVVLSEMSPKMNGGVFALSAVAMVVAMNDITAPSISLEGRTVWLIRSLPVSPVSVFKAKIELHLTLTLLPAMFMASSFVYAFRLDVLSSLLLFLTVPAFILLTGCFGLMMNLVKPFMTWKNETVPMKSSLSVFVTLFGAFALVLVLTVLFLPLSQWITDAYYLMILFVIFGVGDLLLVKWLTTRGVKRFENLT